MSFSRPTLTDLIGRARADIDGRLPGADSRLARSLLDVLARMHAGALDSAYDYQASIARDVMPDSADAEHLDRWASIWGVSRKPAAAAGGNVAVSGIDGSILPAGTVLLRADGARFITGAAIALVAGAATVATTAVQAGELGNTAVGGGLSFASPIVGVSAIAGVAAGGITGGADEETDASLLARLLARIQSPPNGGSANDYVAWALAQPEVTRAWVFPGWAGAGSVGLAVVMDGRDNIFPQAGDLAAIQAALDVLRPVTATLVVFAPTPYPTPYQIRLSPSTVATKASVSAELADLYAREAAPGATLLISHVREAIAVAAGVNDYDLVVPAGNITAPVGYMPTVGQVTWL